MREKQLLELLQVGYRPPRLPRSVPPARAASPGGLPPLRTPRTGAREAPVGGVQGGGSTPERRQELFSFIAKRD
eukprot:5870985-Alexandrium_andersonii.AAC.1